MSGANCRGGAGALFSGDLACVETAARLSSFVRICTGLFARTLLRQSSLYPFFLARLQVKGVTLHVLDYVFRLNLSLKSTQKVFY